MDLPNSVYIGLLNLKHKQMMDEEYLKAKAGEQIDEELQDSM